MIDWSLEGKTAVVCGSTQGIGWATACELSDMGARIVLFARDEDKLSQNVDQLSTAHGQDHQYLVADFDHPNKVEEAITQFIQEQGTVQILVNNSGGPKAGLAIDADPEEFRIAFNRHLVSSEILVKAAVPGMKEAGYGRIINIISTSVKAPVPNLGVSNTIRGAVANWGKTLAHELGPFGITVNNVLPGFTRTARLDSLFKGKAETQGVTLEEIENEALAGIPARRFGRSEEVAMAIAFLASPAAGYINGINLPVDGGRTPTL